MPNHASTSLCHPDHIRALSVQEYARIQEFPDEWVFCGKTSEKYKQIGNAVPVRLGKVTAQVVSDLLEEMQAPVSTAYRDSNEAFRCVYIKSHVRTRRWFKAGEVFSGTDGGTMAYAGK
jgi:DNA (cytosine-5)-methyltransferase 1